MSDNAIEAAAAEGKAEIRGLEETAQFFRVAPQTVKRWIKDGCPVEKEGGNGVPYELDLRRLAAWRRDRAAADQLAAEERLSRDAQLALELLGDDVLPEASGHAGPVTAKQRAEMLRAELDKAKLAEKRRQLVHADLMRDVLAEAFALIREQMRAMPDHLGKEYGHSDDEIAAQLKYVDDCLNDLADAVASIGLAETGPDAAAA